MSDLTPRQTEAFHAIDSFIEENGRPPSFRELAVRLGLKSTHPAYRLAMVLYNQGYVTWETEKRFSLKILRRPKAAKPKAA